MELETNRKKASESLFVPRDDKMRSFSTSTPFVQLQNCKAQRALSFNPCSTTSNDSGLGASLTETLITTFGDSSQTCTLPTISVCHTPSFSVNVQRRKQEGRERHLDLSCSPLSSKSFLARRSLESDFSEQDDTFGNLNDDTLNSSPSCVRKLNLDIDIEYEHGIKIDNHSISKKQLVSKHEQNLNAISVIKTRESALVSDFKEILNKFSPIENDRLIGRKMGRGKVDIIGELSDRNISCVSAILGYLDVKDLCSVCLVNQSWKSTCENDRTANHRRKLFVKQNRKSQQEAGKENFGKKPVQPPGRGVTDPGVLQTLATVQLVSDYPNTTPLTGTSRTSIEPFIQAAKTCTNEEKLMKCPRCRKPAKVLPIQDRGHCQNGECLYDFCVKCLNQFHGSKTCAPLRSPKKKPKDVAIGTKKSKKNLKRL